MSEQKKTHSHIYHCHKALPLVALHSTEPLEQQQQNQLQCKCIKQKCYRFIYLCVTERKKEKPKSCAPERDEKWQKV